MPQGLDLILMMVALFAIMYFMMIRPQQKKMKAQQEMQSQLGAGDRVLLTSGIFATIVHSGERQFIVELAPGTEITVLRGNIARAVKPDEEEFEFTDDIVAADDSSLAEPVEGADQVSDDETFFAEASDESSVDATVDAPGAEDTK